MKKQTVEEKKILIIEDDFDLLWMLKKLLSVEGFNILTAETGTQGLDELSKNSSDVFVLLLDLSLPDKDGEELVKDIHEISPGIPIIITTGSEDRNQFKRLKDLGIQNIMVKPFDLNELVEVINQLN